MVSLGSAVLLLFVISLSLPSTQATKGISDESNPLKYEVDIIPKGKKPPKNLNHGSDLVVMTADDGTKYQCFIPHPPTPGESGKYIRPDVDDIRDSLELLSKTKIYRLIGWWTYEFDHGKHMKQFHADRDGAVVQQSVLGVAGSRAPGVIVGLKENGQSEDSGSDKKDLPYYSETYGGGSLCDLTGLPRSTEVRYYCSGPADAKSNLIAEILEPSTCSYIVSIHTPLMCDYAVFHPKSDTVLKISCVEFEDLKKPEHQEISASQSSQAQDTDHTILAEGLGQLPNPENQLNSKAETSHEPEGDSEPEPVLRAGK